MSSSDARRSRRLPIAVSLVILSVAIILAALFALSRQRGLSGYTEETIQKGAIETTFSFAGNVESKSSAAVTAEKLLQIKEWKVAEGDRVTEGAVLLITTMGDSVTAPIGGTVASVDAQEGDAVMAGAPLCSLMDFEHLQITVRIDEYDLQSVETGKAVEVTVGAADKTLEGTVSSLSRTATVQNGVSYFTAVIDLPQDDSLRVGMSAEAKILNKRVEDALLVPMAALQFNEDNTPYVLVKSGKSRPVSQKITVGINDGLNVQVIDGLSEGQTVLIPQSGIRQSTGLRQGKD